MLRRFGRIVGLFWALVGHTLYVRFAVRRVPEAARPAFKAHRAQRGMQDLCRVLGVRVTREGAPPPGTPMLYVSNHLGLLDTLVLGAELPVSFASKAEVQHWPLLGWVTRTMGTIFVERERRTHAAAFVEQVQAKLQDGVSVLVFPEGTTGPGGWVMPFKTGAFQAVAGRDDGMVLPLYLHALTVEDDLTRGREVIWTGHTFFDHAWHLLGLRRVHMHVRVGAPLPADGRDRKVLARLAHVAVSTLSPEALAPA